MRSGKKNALVSFYRLVETVDPHYNTPIYSKVLFLGEIFCWASPRRGREIEIDGQAVAENYMHFEFDYFDIESVTELMVLTCENVDYDIRGILRDISTKDWANIDAVTRPATTERA